jgi:hypothetical protein
MSTIITGSRSNRRLAWIVLLASILVGVAIVVTPIWIIMPFKAQTERGLAVSYQMRRWSPLVTVVASAAVVLLLAFLWRGSRWWLKLVLVVLTLPLLGATWLARQNHFERMFRPVVNAAFARASEVDFIGDNDMVLAVKNNGEAVAYPVRLMAYHHIFQDLVGGLPIMATY